MYKKARIKLTIIYTSIILIFFWIVSFALYFWFEISLGGGYISKVRELHIHNPLSSAFVEEHSVITNVAGRVALTQLKEILLIINVSLLFIAPTFSWYLTGKALSPVENAHNQQKQFVSNASHEMRVPLSILSGEMEVAMRRNRAAEEYRKIIISAKEEIDRLKILIENLLFLARSDYAKQVISFQPVDVTDLLNSLIAEFHLKITQNKLRVKLIPDEEMVILNAQSQMINILFSNLLDNAIKYTPDRGQIVIEIKKSKRDAVISIKDTGIGIKKVNVEKIFDRFYQVDELRSKTKGFGLGLAIVKSIVEMHSGRIIVNSKLGVGSTFTVYIPLYKT